MNDTGVGPVKFSSRKSDRFGCSVSSLGEFIAPVGVGAWKGHLETHASVFPS